MMGRTLSSRRRGHPGPSVVRGDRRFCSVPVGRRGTRRVRSFSILLGALAIVVFVPSVGRSARPQSDTGCPSPPAPGMEPGENSPRCAGVTHGSFLRSDGTSRREVAFPWFTMQLAESVSAADSAYVVDLIQAVTPCMIQMLGAPRALSSFLFVTWERSFATYSVSGVITMFPRVERRGRDDDGDGRIDEDGSDGRDNDGDGRLDEDGEFDEIWDATFVHELAHGFQIGTDYAPFPGSSGWFEEGFADAAEYVVGECAQAEHPGRRFHASYPNLALAAYDLLSAGGAQVAGGPFNLLPSIWIYRGGSAALLIGVSAELAAGRVSPHPLERLIREVAAEGRDENSSLARAMDRAWLAPIDGLSPPSLWYQTQPITSSRTRSGDFLTLHPFHNESGLNPTLLESFRYRREYGTLSRSRYPGIFRYVDGRGVIVAEQADAKVPPLPPGAYAVEVADSSSGILLTARTHVLVTASARRWSDLRGGVACVFVGADGRVVDLSGVEVDGRVVEEVGGGMLVVPWSRSAPPTSFTFRHDGRTLATITRLDNFARVVPIPVEPSPYRGAMGWVPFLPMAGDSIELFLRRSESDLPQDDSGVGMAVSRCDGVDTLALAPDPADADLWRGKTRVPTCSGSVEFRLAFRADSASAWQCLDAYGGPYRIQVGLDLRPAVIGWRYDGTLNVQLDRSCDPALFSLHTQRAGEDWTHWAAPPTVAQNDPMAVTWTFPTDVSGCAFRVLYGTDRRSRPVFESILPPSGRDPDVLIERPFPNPTSDGVRWSLRSWDPLHVRLDVYNPEGRRLGASQEITVAPRDGELRWDGTAGGRRLPPGVYWLRARLDHRTASTQKIVVLR